MKKMENSLIKDLRFVPYHYVIKKKRIKQYYFGSQYGKHAIPNNLGCRYFSSGFFKKEFKLWSTFVLI